tara:strand:- start:75325 stop:76224 length:900 start_codon:yes stop_codon:yes gene_type:complete
MATSFTTLKKSSANLDRLTKEIEKLNSPTTERQADDRLWQPEVDKAGNGTAVIRFLPSPAVDGDDALPWVRVFSHGFKGPTGKWYIENSLTTLNQKDPVSEYNSHLWNQSSDDNSPTRKQARNQKRRLNYYSNIMVISDPKHPENDGQVFLYRYGKKIFDKIKMAMEPEFEGDEPVNPFDFWTGANLKLRIRNVEGYRNYDQSNFDVVSPLSVDDAKLEEIWNKEYSLKEFLDANNFKPYDELKKRLDEVLAINAENAYAAARQAEPVEEAKEWSAPAASTGDTDVDEDMEYFKKLAED